MKIKVKEIAQVLVALPQNVKKGERGRAQWLKPGNIFEDNHFDKIEIDEDLNPETGIKIRKGDIVIKRISPTFVSVILEDMPYTYYANNLVIVRPIESEIDVDYLGCALNNSIKDFAKKSSVGAIMPTISRKDMEEIEVELFPLQIQEVIGKIWRLSVEKVALQKRLIELEKIKSKQIMDSLLKNKGDY